MAQNQKLEVDCRSEFGPNKGWVECCKNVKDCML